MPLSSVVGAQSIIKPGVCTSSTRPAVPFEGQVIFETDTDRLYVYNGTAWVIPNSPAQNPQGLELVTTATCSSGGTASGGVITIGSAVSSVAVANAFNSTYDNYKIIIVGGAGSTTSAVNLILTGSTTGYYQGTVLVRYDNGAVSGGFGDNTSSFQIGRSSTDTILLPFEMLQPFATKPTMITGSYHDTRGIAGTTAGQYTGFHSVASSFTGFTITFGTGTFTGGTIRVYGYRNS